MPNTVLPFVENGSDGSILKTGSFIYNFPVPPKRQNNLSPTFIENLNTLFTGLGIVDPLLTGMVVPFDGGATPISETNPPIGIAWSKTSNDYYNIGKDSPMANAVSAWDIIRNQRYTVKLNSLSLSINIGDPVYVDPATGLFTNVVGSNYKIEGAFFVSPQDTRRNSSVVYPCPEGDGTFCAQVLFNGV